jgi:hypothetical protein
MIFSAPTKGTFDVTASKRSYLFLGGHHQRGRNAGVNGLPRARSALASAGPISGRTYFCLADRRLRSSGRRPGRNLKETSGAKSSFFGPAAEKPVRPQRSQRLVVRFWCHPAGGGIDSADLGLHRLDVSRRSRGKRQAGGKYHTNAASVRIDLDIVRSSCRVRDHPKPAGIKAIQTFPRRNLCCKRFSKPGGNTRCVSRPKYTAVQLL